MMSDEQTGEHKLAPEAAPKPKGGILSVLSARQNSRAISTGGKRRQITPNARGHSTASRSLAPVSRGWS
jgi:hypothetical protein